MWSFAHQQYHYRLHKLFVFYILTIDSQAFSKLLIPHVRFRFRFRFRFRLVISREQRAQPISWLSSLLKYPSNLESRWLLPVKNRDGREVMSWLSLLEYPSNLKSLWLLPVWPFGEQRNFSPPRVFQLHIWSCLSEISHPNDPNKIP